jgi:hypothetical protein
LSTNAFSLTTKCKSRIDDIVDEIAEFKKFGIVRSSNGVVSFPTKCTPFMKLKKMIPLPKRNVAGVNRERYLGKDCKVYEWDSQHGGFETYRPSGNNESFYHEGESSPLKGVLDPKAKSKRNHSNSLTGFDGVKMKDLCKKHKKGKLSSKEMKRSKAAKKRMSCL